MPPSYSIVVPTYKECGNIVPLVHRVYRSLKENGFGNNDVQMLIVDDNSRDGSVQVVSQLKKEGYNVQIIVRTTERGLSSAVIHGLKQAQGTYLLVMDADLQHPPQVVPTMLTALAKDDVQFVCGTRYKPGMAIDKNWPVHRRLISLGARMLARPLTPLSDPMSGFFGLRASTFQTAQPHLNPIGYKIALELFVKANVRCFDEVGFNFATRTYGESKLTGKVILNYLQHLNALYYFKYGIYFYMFLMLLIAGALFSFYLTYTHLVKKSLQSIEHTIQSY